RIPFNKPFLTGEELTYIAEAVSAGQIAESGPFTEKGCRLLQGKFCIHKVLLAPPCTAALVIAALLCELSPRRHGILPSFTFPSTANAFVRLGVRPVFVDIRPDTLNLDDRLLEEAITPKTRAVVPVHYAGIGCEMDCILALADKHNLLVIEDAAHGL